MNSNNHQNLIESRGACRYFPKCKWGDNCKWEHPKNVPNHKPKTYNSVPQNQQRMQQDQYTHQRPTYNSPYQRPVPFPSNLSKPPPPSHNPPPYNPYFYNASNPQMLIHDSLPCNQFSATVSPQYNVDNHNLINIPLVPCNEMYM